MEEEVKEVLDTEEVSEEEVKEVLDSFGKEYLDEILGERYDLNNIKNPSLLLNMVLMSDSILKIIAAIMNEEKDIDAYSDKGPSEMIDILNILKARYPNIKKASYDPTYIKYGQACLTGYSSFGVDFLNLLANRQDEVKAVCYKGLIDLIENLLVTSQYETLNSLDEEERTDIEKNLVNAEKMTDSEFKEVLKNNE